MPLFQDPDSLNPGHSGQPDIYQRNLRQVGRNRLNRRFHARIHAGHFEPGSSADQYRQSFPYLALIFNDCNPEQTMRIA